MKVQRPGHTESHLLYSNFLKEKYPEKYDASIEYFFIKWLYKTTGFYDKSIDINNISAIIDSECYNKWIKLYNKAIYRCEHLECCIGNPNFADRPPEYLYEYLMTLNPKSLTINGEYVYRESSVMIDWKKYWCLEGYNRYGIYDGVFHKQYNLLENKKVLIISAFSELIEYQYKNNVHKIFKNFPKFDLITYTSPYTFLNNGPNSNFFDTLDNINNEIIKIDFDIALLSCGSYAAFLIDSINQNIGKDAIYMGRGCSYMFGIDPKRNPTEYKDWIIDIPTKFIPDYYEQIEDGIYWSK